jgi:hypothetical protein
MTARLLVEAGASNAWWRPTLIVRYRHHHDCEEKPPHAESIDNGRKEAVAVEVCNHVGDFGVRRGRHKTRVDGHVDGEATRRKC